jgi:hypothetical protein
MVRSLLFAYDGAYLTRLSLRVGYVRDGYAPNVSELGCFYDTSESKILRKLHPVPTFAVRLLGADSSTKGSGLHRRCRALMTNQCGLFITNL